MFSPANYYVNEEDAKDKNSFQSAKKQSMMSSLQNSVPHIFNYHVSELVKSLLPAYGVKNVGR